MAQIRTRKQGASRLHRQSGLFGRQGQLLALVVLALASGAAGVAAHRATGAVEVVRGQALMSGMDAGMGGTAEAGSDGTTEVPREEETAESRSTECFVVHVDGAVAQPGVVELEGAGLRVRDAVEAAGGLVEGADTTTVNLAEPLRDGSKIHIPLTGEEERPTVAGQAVTVGATGDGGSLTLVNLNTASSEELQRLPGVGEATAAAIIREREQNGPFATPEDVMRVSGIGEKKFEKMRDAVCV